MYIRLNFGKTQRPLPTHYLCWHWRKKIQFNHQSRYAAPAQPWHYIEDRKPWHYGNCLHGIAPTPLFTSVLCFHCCLPVRCGGLLGPLSCSPLTGLHTHSTLFQIVFNTMEPPDSSRRAIFHWGLPYRVSAFPVYDLVCNKGWSKQINRGFYRFLRGHFVTLTDHLEFMCIANQRLQTIRRFLVQNFIRNSSFSGSKSQENS